MRTKNPVVWAVGVTRDHTIQYITPDRVVEPRRPYWATTFASARDAVSTCAFFVFKSDLAAAISHVKVATFLADFPNALQRATALDARILSDASTVSSAYADLVSLAARQAVGGVELTVGPDGTSSDVKMFVQETSEDS